MINKQSFVPIYVQIAQAIIQSIQDGIFPYGEQIPSERDLADQHQVSRLTVRQAIDELVTRGVAYRVQGKGTFVARPQIRQASGLISFSDELIQRGYQPSSKIVRQEIVPASELVAAKFQIPNGNPVFQLNRVRLANELPVAIEYATLNSALFPNIEQENFETLSLYELIRNRYGIYPAWAEAEIDARVVTEEEQNWLRVPAGLPVIVAHRMTFTDSFELIELVDSVYISERFPIYMGRQRILTELDKKT